MPTCLDRAEAIVTGNRRWKYGSPADNLEKIARLWSDAFEFQFTGLNVALAMILAKCGREGQSHKMDNFDDICGWAACAEDWVHKYGDSNDH